MRETKPLKRILGTPTALLLGMGVAIGSGIFRTPGEVAGYLHAPWIIMLAWLLGGGVTLMQGMITAELSTRFPKAGGEYVYLREAFGEFAAFFFGWSYTIFILGGAAATIGRAFGDFGCDLFSIPLDNYPHAPGLLAAAAIALVVAVNIAGLRSGARSQNALTVMKIVALAALIAVGFIWSGDRGAVTVVAATSPSTAPTKPFIALFFSAMLSVHWSYDGATDSVKMAEEIKDVRRAMPRALIGCAVSLTILYMLVNIALMRLIPAGEMGSHVFPPGEAMRRVFGDIGNTVMLVVAMLVCLGALNSMFLAAIRVTYALARDGLAFRFMSNMSAGQAPVPALLVVGVFGCAMSLWRPFTELLGIYYFASAILFGLAYGSLIVFRRRDRGFPDNVYRCPAGPLMVTVIIVIQCALAINVAFWQPRDVLYSAYLLLALALLYFVWKRPRRAFPPGHCQRCGYDLTGLAEPRCPECGTIFDSRESAA